MTKELHYQLTLLLRSIYLRGQADANRKTANMDWEDNIISQINQLFKADLDERDELQKVHEAELGVCEQHCSVVKKLKKLFSEGKELPKDKHGITMIIHNEPMPPDAIIGKDKEVEKSLLIVKRGRYEVTWNKEKSDKYNKALDIILDFVERKR